MQTKSVLTLSDVRAIAQAAEASGVAGGVVALALDVLFGIAGGTLALLGVKAIDKLRGKKE